MSSTIIQAAILPLGRTQFLDNNGVPLAGGSVTFYVPGTNTLKDTWQDPYENTLNTNPVLLDAAGSAIIYGSGQYTMLVQDVNGNIIYEALTADGFIGTSGSLQLFLWCGTATGGPNTYSVSPNPAIPGPTLTVGQPLAFVSSGTAGFANTGASTLTITNITSPIPIRKIGFAGVEALRGGEIYDGAVAFGIYDGTQIVLLGNARQAEGTTFCGTSSGSANAQALTPAGITSIGTGQIFTFIVGGGLTNTAAATVSINGGFAFNLYKATPAGTTPLEGGELCEGMLAICTWDGTHMQLVNPFRSTRLVKASGTQSPGLSNDLTSYIATGAMTIDLPVTADMYNGYQLTGFALSGAITLQPNAADAIDNGTAGASVTIGEGGAFIIETDGAGNWYLLLNTTPAAATLPVRAFAIWNGNGDGTGTLVAAQNVASITQTATGTYNVVLSGGFNYTHGGALLNSMSGGSGKPAVWGAANADITGTNPTFVLVCNGASGGGSLQNIGGFATLIVVGV
jgi:hypothetical protein